MKNVLPFKENFIRLISWLDLSCPLCNYETESIQHLFLRCNYFHALLNAWRGEVKLFPFKDLDLHTFCLIFLKPLPNLLPKNVNSFDFSLAVILVIFTI